MSHLQIENIHAGYFPGLDILRGVNLSIEKGQTYCVIGPNGAGKSTLLKVICGLLKPHTGSIVFDGEEVTGLKTHQMLNRGICFVPQDRSLFPEMTVAENLKMGGYLLKDRAEVQRRVDEVLELFPILKERRSASARSLSGGQQQMLAIGRTLVLKPSLIMLDEPSLGLAPQVARQIYDSVRTLRESGLTVLLVEQNAHLGLAVSDWGVVLDLGTTDVFDEAQKILHNPRIRELYLGKGAKRET